MPYVCACFPSQLFCRAERPKVKATRSDSLWLGDAILKVHGRAARDAHDRNPADLHLQRDVITDVIIYAPEPASASLVLFQDNCIAELLLSTWWYAMALCIRWPTVVRPLKHWRHEKKPINSLLFTKMHTHTHTHTHTHIYIYIYIYNHHHHCRPMNECLSGVCMARAPFQPE